MSLKYEPSSEQVMVFATKAVLHPTAALYDTRAHSLHPAYNPTPCTLNPQPSTLHPEP